MRPQDLDARWYAQELSRQIPECADLHAISNVSDTPESLQALLDCAAELLLHPEQTVRVARALRPLLLDVVARALSSVRDGSVKSLGCRNQTPIEREEGVLVAMSRLLPAAPHALPLALDHWRASPCPFEFLRASGHPSRVNASGNASRVNANRTSVDQSVTCTALSDERDEGVTLHRVHRVVEAAQRLLSAGVPGLHDLWSWAPFFDLCRHDDALVRWRAVGICALLLELDEQGRRTLLTAANASNRLLHDTSGVENAEVGAAAATGPLPTSEGGLDSEVLLEAELDLLQQLRDARTELHSSDSYEGQQASESSSSGVQEQSDGGDRSGVIGDAAEGGVPRQVPYAHHPDVQDVGGILHPTRSAPSVVGDRSVPRPYPASSRSTLVSTASSRRNLSRLSLAMVVERPILLHGAAGCGKSLLAREAAFMVGGGGQTPLLELHLDDQTDSKSLLGSHTCTDVPGEFAWRPGALTRAAVTGTWVLIEDLDRAPFEVLAALGPLLEGRPLALPGRSKPLRAAPGFRVFGTVTTVGTGRVTLGVADFGALWTHVPVEPLSVEEVLEVTQVRHPGLPRPVSARLLDTMRIACGDPGSTYHARGAGALLSARAGGRVPSVRDFFKLCARIDCLGIFDPAGMSTSDAWICSEAQALAVIMESLDVFAGHLSTKDALTSAVEALAGQWNVLPSKVVDLALSRRPEFVVDDSFLKIGRVTLPRLARANHRGAGSSFAPTSHALRLMESLAASVQACEPVLLVGETGCGKTAVVQQLAQGSGRELVVQNLSLQTDGADLLGGFRPVELRQLAQEVLEEFLRLFPTLFSASQNRQFCDAVTGSFERRQWKRLSAGLKNAAKVAMEKLDRSEERSTDTKAASNKSRRSASPGGATSPSGRRRDWDQFNSNVERFERQRLAVEGSFAFSFVEGVLVKAIREGKWVLLDEINLASAETLQRLSGLLEGSDGSICLTERGDVDHIVRHPNFRLFAAMNPPTDASKKDLPPALRRRFSEVYVPELEDRVDLKRVADGYLAGISPEQENLAFTAVDLYLWARKLALESLSDGAGQRPRYSLRTLVTALSASRRLVDRGFHARRAMVEGCRGAFETQLDGEGRDKILKGVMKAFGKGMTDKDLEKPPRRPGGRTAAGDTWIRIGPFWLEGGPLEPVDNAVLDPETNLKKFVLTPSVQSTLRCLARTVASTDSPVLLQGPTSAGKTSIVEYLARKLGHRCVRINNHEHTDIQEYTGSYAADANGKLVFQEGILVESLRKGYWIILDELNLAPSEVLEALNRLLDHNRELYVPETQETIKPHPSFRLFATQNPPGAYGGRKPLSRAFRNRFMEVHVDDIPGGEWESILVERCGLAPSHCKLLVKVFKELQRSLPEDSHIRLPLHVTSLWRWSIQVLEDRYLRSCQQAQRHSSRLFLGKHSAISPRDLLRWAGRKPLGKREVGEEGYMLLAERLRTQEEKDAMKVVLEGQVGVALDVPALYGGTQPSVESVEQTDQDFAENADSEAPPVDQSDLGGVEQLKMVEVLLAKGAGLEAGLKGVAMTRHMRRLFRLTGRCISHLEPVLLVGETGCGKTTVCQLYSMLLKRRMHVVNCHQNTEAADLLGGLRPLRGREALVSELRARGDEFMSRCSDIMGATPSKFSGFSMENDVEHIVSTLQEALKAVVEMEAGGNIRSGPPVDTPSSLLKRPRMDDEKDDPVGAPATSEVPTAPTSTKGPRDAGSSLGINGEKDTPARSKRRRKHRGARSPPSAAKEEKNVFVDGQRDQGPSTSLPAKATENAPLHLEALAEELVKLRELAKRTKGLFEWVDGPLVSAMRNGELILLDELSLADDAVLERLNSVLEPGRSITLAEKGGERSVDGITAETVVAATGFRVMATMNPGGDFGKRELSPALRSRFTEVWVPALSAREDMEGVVTKAFNFRGKPSFPELDLGRMATSMLEFAWWFNNEGGGSGVLLSVRDLLSWAGFITDARSTVMNSGSDCKEDRALQPWEAYVHGAALVLLDGLGLGSSLPQASVMKLRQASVDMLSRQIPDCLEREVVLTQLARDGGESSADRVYGFVVRERRSPVGLSSRSRDKTEFKRLQEAGVEQEFGIVPFFTACGPGGRLEESGSALDFSIRAPTTAKNLHRVLRALQVPKAVLLEGSPGVGKTSLVAALAAVTGHELVRINLSEQTDATDLFGSDLPVPEDDGTSGSSSGARFAWCDGVFLRALKEGKWVLLDELNLATQSVLEGLNACLDHRAEVFIPELGRSFRCPPTFKIFAAQNPLAQGGGRKGLPRSFLSRFTKVFVDPLTTEDLLYIAANKFPALATARSLQGCHEPSSKQMKDKEQSLLARMIKFNSLVQDDIKGGLYGRKGSPWEFNLRDVFRWCELMVREQSEGVMRQMDQSACHAWEPWLVIDSLYTQRMRTSSDRAAIVARFKEVFPEAFPAEGSGFHEKRGIECHVPVRVSPPFVRVGQTVLERGCWGHALDVDDDGRIPLSLPMPIRLRQPLQGVARCVAMGWPALVVGHRGSGKTSLIHGLASAVGARLTEVAMTPSTDVTELLGCFEQTDVNAAHDAFRDALHAVVRLVCGALMSLEGKDDVAEVHDSRAKVGRIWDIWHGVKGCYKEPLASSVAPPKNEPSSGFEEQGLDVVRTLLGTLRDAVKLLSNERIRPKDVLPVDSTSSSLCLGEDILGAIKQRMEDIEQLEDEVRREVRADRSQQPDRDKCSGSCFRWNDGLLVKALERGDWMLLDGANLCPASVLDRLNPLLEPGGKLLLTECGVPSDGDRSDGKHRVVRPHPNFRLFLTADPSCGEVSRAMRNRCVEIFVLEPSLPALAVDGTGSISQGAPKSRVERFLGEPDAVGVLHATGVRDVREVENALGIQHGRRVRSSRFCRDSVRDYRQLLLYGQLAAALKNRAVRRVSLAENEAAVALAYPDTGGLIRKEDGDRRGSGPLYFPAAALAQPGWRDLLWHGPVVNAMADSRILQVACILAGASTSGQTQRSGRVKCTASLESTVVDHSYSPGVDVVSLVSDGDAVDAPWANGLLIHAAALYARRTCACDRGLRSLLAKRLQFPLVEEVKCMISLQIDTESWAEISAFSSSLAHEGLARPGGLSSTGRSQGGIKELAMFCASPYSLPVTGSRSEMFGVLERASQAQPSWAVFRAMLLVHEMLVASRLPIRARESRELRDSRAELDSAVVDEHGLTWWGLSYLASEGGRDLARSGGRHSLASGETRLARTSLVQYLVPLVRCVDALAELLFCKDIVERFCSEGDPGVDDVLSALAVLMDARDTISTVLGDGALESRVVGEAPPLEPISFEFPWDRFLVAWGWLQEAVGALWDKLPKVVREIDVVANAWAGLSAVRSRVGMAVLQHAGGRRASRSTLWVKGSRARVPATKMGAQGLARLHDTSDSFDLHVVLGEVAEGGETVLSMARLMASLHPSLYVSREIRSELLHGVSTLHWAVCCGLEASGEEKELAQMLPQVAEESIKTARSKWETRCKGVRLLGLSQEEVGMDMAVDTSKEGSRFDEFEMEEAAALANATLVVDVGDGDDALGRFGVIQLSPFVEHWLAVEECEVLAKLCQIYVELKCSSHDSDGSGGEDKGLNDSFGMKVGHLMIRLKKIIGRVACTPSLPPSAGWPYQTLCWAWEQSGLKVMGPLLSHVLPVALEGWARRLWENVYSMPGLVSGKLGPPPMLPSSAESECPSDCLDNNAEARGPAQMMSLVRSWTLLRLCSTAVFHRSVVALSKRDACGVVDLSLMNAEARVSQFRGAMRLVRDLAPSSRWVLVHLLDMIWARVFETMGAFDGSGDEYSSQELLRTVSEFRFGISGPFEEAWGRVEGRVRSLVDACSDERLASMADLVVSAIRAVCRAAEMVYSGATEDIKDARVVVGLASAMVGCVRFELLVPSTPVDPGLRPAIEKGLVAARLADLRYELVVEHLASRVDGGPEVTLEMAPRLRKARCLGQEYRRLEEEAIERIDDRPPFSKLFHDVRSYADGIGSVSRVSSIAGSLADLAGESHGLRPPEASSMAGHSNASLSSSAVLHEERVWQESTVEFLSRCRTQFMPAYADVITGICEAVESCRLGIRLMSAAVGDAERTAAVSRSGSDNYVVSVDPLEELRSFLLQFPYAACDHRAGESDTLAAQLRKISGGAGFESALKSSMSGPQHVAILLAALSRAELLLLARCSDEPVVDAIVSVLDRAVWAWSQAEAEEAERRRKEAEILQYKTQEHTVTSEEEREEARLRALFPDYHGGYKDIVRDSYASTSKGDEGVAVNEGGDRVTKDEWVKSLGYLSNEQLGLLVASHARIFCGLLRRRCAVMQLATGWRTSSAAMIADAGASDVERLAAHGDCYRACILLGVSTWSAPSYAGMKNVKSEGPQGTSGSSDVVTIASDSSPGVSGGLVQLEAAYAPVHLLALADASVLCATGRNLLEHVVTGTEPSESSLGSSGARARQGIAPIWGGDRATERSLRLVDPFSDFQLDANVGETRRAYRPLSTILRRVGSLLEEFPGNGILITVARVADRVRRMSLHSPVAAVLAGVELVLRKAQDWEQYAHRGVSLKDDLRLLNALVVRWRELELKSWSELLDARERVFVAKANRWWLHLFRLLTGEWEGQAKDASQDAAGEPEVRRSPISPPDWLSARRLFPDWLWSGLPSKSTGSALTAKELRDSVFEHDISQHARDLFKSLDDFIRTSPVGEFFARLHMLRSFAAQLSLGATPTRADATEGGGRRQILAGAALGTLLQGLWVYYSQFSEEVTETRDLVRRSLEKKLKEEAKLGRWDEQTYYSLAESSEKSHRKLTKLVMQYDEVLEVSFAEVLHKTLVAGVGERKEQAAAAAPSTEVPSLAAMFIMVKKVDTAVDFVEEDSSADGIEVSPPDGCVNDGGKVSRARPSKIRKHSEAGRTALELLQACFPVAPSHQPELVEWGLGQAAASTSVEIMPLVKETLFGCKSCSGASGELPLLARLPSLSRRMQSLLKRWVYARGLKDVSTSDLGGTGLPAGFVGAGLAEELCSAVFARIKALHAKGVGKQVKKRAVLDLLGGLRREGVGFSRVSAPKETCDTLHVMGLSQPFSADRLAGLDASWVMACEGGNGSRDTAVGLMLEGAERYYVRGVCELSRLRMEASAPASRDVTRREVEMMRGLADNLAVLVLQQRGVTAVLEAEVVALARETRAFKALTDDVRDDGAVSLDAGSLPLPSQVGVREALEEQRQGLHRAMESIREVLMLLKAVEMGDPPSSDGSLEKEQEIGDRPIDTKTISAVSQGVRKLESSISVLLDGVRQFPECIHGSRLESAIPLLGHGALRRVLYNQEALRKCGMEALDAARRYAHVLPASPLERIGSHCAGVVDAVDSLLRRREVLAKCVEEGATWEDQEGPEADGATLAAANVHVSNVGSCLSEAVKALLLSVQALSPREITEKDGEEEVAGEVAGADDPAEDGVQRSVEYSLHEAHVRAFTEAHAFKLRRCINSMSAVRESIHRWTEDGVANRGAGGEVTKDAQRVVVGLAGDVVRLAEQVLGAGKAILTGMVAFNKGTAKLHYVVVRVFRTLLSKGLCSDETEEDDGEGEGDIQGMKFEDDVEGTGMGEGDGKKDVTDEIEDEEQLLGLKGEDGRNDEQPEESKELGDDEKDTGMEMENDFEGQMFDVPKGEEKGDEGDDADADDKEELDREMGDLGDEADVVDEKLWDGDEEDEEGDNDQPEKFESGSRLDGEKPEEDEIRTKEEEDGTEGKQQQGQQGDGDDEQGEQGEEAGKDDRRDAKGQDGADEDQGGGDEEAEGPINDDLEENYEDKPLGVEVRAEDEAIEVDEQAHGVEGDEEEDGDEGDAEKGDELPDNMDLDGGGADGEDEEDDEQGQEDGEESVSGDEPEPQGKEGFESLAPEEGGPGDQQELEEDEEQPEGSKNPGAPELDAMEEEAKEGELGDDGSDVEQRKAEEDEPPAFGVEGQGGDEAMLEASVKEEGEKGVEEKDAESERVDEQGRDEKGGGGTGAAEGGDDGGGTGEGDEGDGGQLRPQVSQGKGLGESQGRDKRRRPEAPNPFRDPGDAMRHWHRRLEMLRADNAEKEHAQDEAEGESGPQDEGEDEKGEGTYEYVSSGEKGSSQVLGGVSEEQAAEAAAQQASKEEGDDAQDGDDAEDGEPDRPADALDGLESMPEDPSLKSGAHDENEEVLEADLEDEVEARRKSSSRRDEEGYQLRTEEEADTDSQKQEEVEKAHDEEKGVLDIDALEEPSDPSSAGAGAQIVTKPVGVGSESTGAAELSGSPQATMKLREQLLELAEELQQRKQEAQKGESHGAGELWGRLRSVTASLAQRLCEQLRLVLEPMLATKLQGDYRSGKRINMRRVIPYIASGFRKDKIWLRRTKAAKRDYQILLAIDDSESMADCGAGSLALAAMATVASGLTQLEVGQLAVARFGEEVDLLHAFGEPFTEDAGAHIVEGFSFDQPRTNTARTLEGIVALLEEARSAFSVTSSGVGTKATPRQLVLLLSDGRFDRENKDRLRSLVREMNERGQLLVMIVLDKEGDTSILKTREASYVGGKLVISNYLDSFPFPLYILLSHMEALPETLADALRQWFELLQRQASS